MPQAVTHILIPIILVSLFKDYYDKTHKNKMPLHYALIAGLGGVLPDIDIPISFVLNIIGVQNWWIHKTFLHSLFFPLTLFAIFILLSPTHTKARICNLGKHNLKLSLIFLVLSLGALAHISLDSIFGEMAYFFYPFSMQDYGINLTSYLPSTLQGLFIPTLDGILLVIWIVYLELKHKISDFI